MAKYTYSDVIVSPDDPRVKVGDEYYFGDNVGELLHGARTGWRTGVLRDVCKATDDYSPFYNGSSGFSCIIRKKELSYAKRQDTWLADNDVKKGDKVRVVRKAKSLDDGWQTVWNPYMDEAVGKVGTVSHISANFRECGIEVDVPDVGAFMYPYFVLEKVELKYKPFCLIKEEDRAKLRGSWIKFKTAPEFEYLICAIENEDVTILHEDLIESIDAIDLLRDWLFLDGSPCGKLAEEVENEA